MGVPVPNMLYFPNSETCLACQNLWNSYRLETKNKGKTKRDKRTFIVRDSLVEAWRHQQDGHAAQTQDVAGKS